MCVLVKMHFKNGTFSEMSTFFIKSFHLVMNYIEQMVGFHRKLLFLKNCKYVCMYSLDFALF